ncbi:Gfo/Idh/MocA family protein, partial [Draconibacterium sp.]|uniref:Gfo/Idh/MocA family protein n=1 Tax=Draconibacterium sp. TaxID=1965318 RepID=UPI0035667E82
MSETKNNNRRTFIKNAALGVGALTIVPGHVVFGRPGRIMPSDKVNVAFCGIGNRGGQILREIMQTGMVNNVAMCDTDMGAKHTSESMKTYPKAEQFKDFRVMFDKMNKSIDAVVVGTPDFSHFPITILAMSLGKHVYVEKPLTRTFQESELLMNAAKKYKVVTQMGNQGHSEGNYFQFKTWVENGIIKDVTKVVAHMNNSRRWHGWDTGMISFPKGEPVPKTLDWDTWLGTAQFHEYNHDYINGQWRCWYDFGMGALGDWGAHIIDTVHEFLDLGLPYEVDPVKIEGHNPLFYPQATTLDFKFPERNEMPPLTISWYDGINNQPELPENYGTSELADNIPAASTGQIEKRKLNPGKIIYGKELTFKGGSHGSTLSILPSEKAEQVMTHLPKVPESPSNHFENFVLACRGEEKTRSPFEISAPLSQVFVLGTIAQHLNTKIEFDRTTKQIKNNTLANDLLVGPPPRK